MKGKAARSVGILRVIHSLSIMLCAICLMCACVSIYHSGEAPYSRAAVAAAFSKIAVPVYFCLGLTLVNFILTLLLPQAKTKPRHSQDLQATLERLHASRDPSAEEAVASQITQQQRCRRRYRLLCAAALTVLSILFLIYALDGSHFQDSDINGSMVKAMYRLIPCLSLAFAAALATTKQLQRSMETEIALLKQLPKRETPPKAVSGSKDRRTAILRLCFVVLGIGLITLGAATGGIADVLAKAINICTECIGLG